MGETNSIHASHILIVEDDVMLGEMLEEVIGRYHETMLLDRAEHVFEVLQQQPIELLMLDIMLPNVDGFQLLTAIREQYSSEELSIIIISALDDADSIVRGFGHGANDYIVKPVEIAVMMARITTQLKLMRLQNERNRYIDHLERSEQLSKQLSQIASHDLKNPLNNLRIAEGLLHEELAGNPRARQVLNTVGASLDMMEEVVGSFLDMVAIQTQNINLRVEPVSIRDIINRASAQYELAAADKDISLRVGQAEGVVLADAGRMTQIAGNLVSNAIKYSPHGSEVSIWSEIKNGILRLYVADEGPGVPKDERDLLFKEFSRLSTRPTAGESSTGLGLWIVKHLIEMQGGRVGVSFPQKGGSVFWIEIGLNPEFS